MMKALTDDRKNPEDRDMARYDAEKALEHEDVTIKTLSQSSKTVIHLPKDKEPVFRDRPESASVPAAGHPENITVSAMAATKKKCPCRLKGLLQSDVKISHILHYTLPHGYFYTFICKFVYIFSYKLYSFSKSQFILPVMVFAGDCGRLRVIAVMPAGVYGRPRFELLNQNL